MKRGDVVIADLAYSDRQGSKVRPAVVVSTDRNNSALDDVILVAISRSSRSAATTHILVDPATSDGQQTGLLHRSFIQCENIFTLDKGLILKTIGTPSVPLAAQVNAALRFALELP
jgi:mRNA interferase MazF